MDSRGRVMKALRFEEADRVPVDLGGTTGASGIHVLAYAALKKSLGLPCTQVKCNDLMQQLAVIEPEVMERLHLDVAQVSPVTFAKEWHPLPLYPGLEVLSPQPVDLRRVGNGWELRNHAGALFRKPDSSLYFDAADGKGWFNFHVPLTDAFLAGLARDVARLHETTPHALSTRFGGGFFSSDPDFLERMLEEPEEVGGELLKRADGLIETYGRLWKALGERVFCVIFADDFGTQNAPMLSPALFERVIAPAYRRFSSWLHRETPWKLYLHSCGSIEPLMESIVAMGVDLLNPIQTSATGMDPAALKAKYGKRLVFWGGGCDTQGVLGKVPLAELRRHVRERVGILKPGGGFVFNQVHAIQADVPAADILALFDTVHECGGYG